LAKLVKALRYTLEDRGFDSRWVIEIFHLSGRSVAVESTQPLTEMNTRNLSWGKEATGA
jgi:hypothetical protein